MLTISNGSDVLPIKLAKQLSILPISAGALPGAIDLMGWTAPFFPATKKKHKDAAIENLD